MFPFTVPCNTVPCQITPLSSISFPLRFQSLPTVCQKNASADLLELLRIWEILYLILGLEVGYRNCGSFLFFVLPLDLEWAKSGLRARSSPHKLLFRPEAINLYMHLFTYLTIKYSPHPYVVLKLLL